MPRHKKEKPRCACEQELLAQDASIELLSQHETEAIRRRWLEVYARGCPKDISLANAGGFDWHVFSYGATFALAGADAMQAYLNLRTTRFLIVPDVRSKLPGCRCTCDTVPRLDGACDVYVSAADFSWTMVFTHEEGWFGPYFSRAEWVARPPRSKVPRRR